MSKRIPQILFTLALVAIGSQAANAQSVPIKGSGTDSIYDPETGHYSGVGRISHMGLSSFEGTVIPTSGEYFPAPGIFFEGTFIGVQEITAANGDKLFSIPSGTVTLSFDTETGLIVGFWEMTWQVTGGTGRFAGASGLLEGTAINPPFNPAESPWDFNWSFTGELNKAKGNNK